MPKKSRATFDFETTSAKGGPLMVTVRASSYISDDTRSMMIPMLEPALYLVQRIIGRVRTGKDAEGGAFPKKVNGKPKTFFRTGYMFRNFTPKAASPTRVSYAFTKKHMEMAGSRSTLRWGGTIGRASTRKMKKTDLGNADLARILNSDDRVKVDFHRPSKKELDELDRLTAALLTPQIIAKLGLAESDFQAEKRARKALADAKKANGKGTRRGMK